MGMYDIVKGIKVYCHKCGNVITNEFQTKDFEYPVLHEYNIGDKVPVERDAEDYIEIHSMCETCNLFASLYVAINNDKLTDELV